jgi:hypothetical protein
MDGLHETLSRETLFSSARDRSPDFATTALTRAWVARPSRLDAVTVAASYLSLTVAGQWRIFTAFPNIPRVVLRAELQPSMSIAVSRGDEKRWALAQAPGSAARTIQRARACFSALRATVG